MATHKQLRDLCHFQYWLGSNFTTLPTDSTEMTKRSCEYLNCKNAMVIFIEKDTCPYCKKNEKYKELKCCEQCAQD
jgi:hypothetical protein